MIISLITLTVVLGILGCGNVSGSDGGVASVRETKSVDENMILENDTESEMNLTDEEITTIFTDCLRSNGLDVPDPELNADGTIDWGTLKSNFDQGTELDQRRTEKMALQNCLPLLAGATFSRDRSKENEIKLQDDLLEFAQCLRDAGINVPDPDFSENTRGAMKPLYQSLGKTNSSTQEKIDLCNETILGGRNRGRNR